MHDFKKPAFLAFNLRKNEIYENILEITAV